MWFWWLLFWILVIVGAGYGLRKYLGGDQSYWPSRKFTFLKHSKVASLYARTTLQIRMHELDQKIYQWFKSHGQRFGGVVEMRSPTLFLTDLDLVKHVMV